MGTEVKTNVLWATGTIYIYRYILIYISGILTHLIGGDNWCSDKIPTFGEAATEMSPRSGEKEVVQEKESCWHCFKLFGKDSGFEDAATNRVYIVLIYIYI